MGLGNTKSQISNFAKIGALSALAFALALYQNCSQSFKTVNQDNSILSSLCQAKIKSSLKSLPIGKIDCESPANYHCEERIFNPNISDSLVEKSQCADLTSGENFCVGVSLRSISTESASHLDGAAPKEFQPGGEFNRTEVTCQHLAQFRGVALIVGHADNLPEALKSTIAQCQSSQEATQ